VTDTGILDSVLNNFTSAISGSWGPFLSAYLLPLMLGLIVLQVGMLAFEAAIAQDIPLLLSHALLGLLRVGIVWAIFLHAFDWGNDIVQSGQQLGNNISGFALTPSGVFDNGIGIMQTIFQTRAVGSWYEQPFEKLEFYVVGASVMFCWMVASVIYLGTLIEAALLVYVAPLIIAFTPISWTFEMLLVWGKSLLGIAFKLALILMTLAVGMLLANDWIATVTATSTTFTTNMWNMLICVVEAILFAFCVWRFPNRISGLTAGAAFMGLGEAMFSMGSNSAQAAMSGGGSSGGSGGGSSNSGGSSSGGSNQGGGSQSSQTVTTTAQPLAQQVQTKLTT
jgi:P-type conjugative transfer protein TrbL